MKPKTIKALVFGIPAAIIMVCASGGVVLSQRALSERELALNNLAKVGLPRHANDVKHTPHPSRDAGALIAKLQAAERAAARTDVGKKFTADMTGDVELRKTYLNAHPELLRLSRQIFKKTELATLTDPSLGPALLLPQYAGCKTATKIAGMKAQVLAREGQPVEALNLLTEAANFASVVNNDSLLISELVGISVRTIAHRFAMDILTKHKESPAVRQAMSRYLVASYPNIDMRRAIPSEVSLGLASEELVKQGKFSIEDIVGLGGGSEEEVEIDDTLVKLIQVPGVRERLFANLYSAYHDLYLRIPKSPRPHRARITAAAEWDSYVDRLDSPNEALIKILMPIYKGVFEGEAKATAEWRTLNAILVAADFKATTGKYPTKLPVTGPESLDPFTEKPLVYVHSVDTVKIYSVGADGKDNGGLLFQPKSESESRDYDYGYSIPYVVPKRR